MRRLPIVAILAVASALALPLHAQRGGMAGHGGGMAGHAGGVGRGPGIGVRGPAMPGGRFGGVAVASRMTVNNGRFGNGRFGVNNRTVFLNGHRHNCFGGFNCRNRFFFNNGFGFFPGFGVPYNYIPGFYPSDYNQQPEAQQPIVVSGDEGGNTELAMAIQHLSDQIEDLKQDQNRQAQARQPGVSLSARSAAETTFVFRDGHRMTTENYAIAGQTLWVFNERLAKKFPLSDLDRSATEQANADNGVDVHLP